jgi:hypothetical protein
MNLSWSNKYYSLLAVVALVVMVGCEGEGERRDQRVQQEEEVKAMSYPLLEQFETIDGRQVMIPKQFDSVSDLKDWASKNLDDPAQRPITEVNLNGRKCYVASFFPYSGSRFLLAIVVTESRGRLQTVMTKTDVPFHPNGHQCDSTQVKLVYGVAGGFVAELDATDLLSACRASDGRNEGDSE